MQREVVFLEAQQLEKIGQVRKKFDLNSKSEALRFLIDTVDPDAMEDHLEAQAALQALEAALEMAERAGDRAEAALVSAERYFDEVLGDELEGNDAEARRHARAGERDTRAAGAT